uniref:Uncharacterized protein n=1 Tax=Arundo donax TaxID=35708 RepID=A0A0A9CI98_ARUDO
MERKRMKKLRQKEQRLKDLKDEDVTVRLSEITDDATDSHGIQSLEAISDPGLYEQEDSQHLQIPTREDNGFNVDQSVEDDSCDLGHGMNTGVTLRQQVISRRHVGSTENLAQNSSVSGPAVASKHPARRSNYRDPNVCALSNRNKTWEWKVRAVVEEQCPKHESDIERHGMVVSKNSRVLIGSISVAIEDGSGRSRDLRHSEHDPTPPSLKIINHSVIEVPQPISHEESGNKCIPHDDGNITPAVENHFVSNVMTDKSSCSTCCNADLTRGGHLQRTMFSSKEATAFLSRRWKDAIAADHVKLVVS